MEFGNYFIEIKGSYTIFFGLIILAAFWSYFIYRRTVPPASSAWRFCLGSLRFLALLILVFLLFEPAVTFQTEKTLKPLLPVVIDDTQSMQLSDRAGERSALLQDLLSRPVWQTLQDRFDLQYFTAGDSLHKIQESALDSLTYRTVGTDLTIFWRGLPRFFDQESYPACIIISDGGDNAGRDPLDEIAKMAKPLFTIGIGDTSAVIDAGIMGVSGDVVAYQGKESSLTVRIKSRGLENQRGQLLLRDQAGNVLASKEIKLSVDGLLQEIDLDFTLDETGDQALSVELVTSKDEWSTQNNQRGYPITVKESRIRILLVEGFPSFESMFLKQTLNELEDLEIQVLTLKKEGGFYDHQIGELGLMFSQSDVLILVNLDGSSRSSNAYQQIVEESRRSSIPRWVWLTANTDTRIVGDFIPDHGIRFIQNPRLSEGQAVPRRYYEILEPDAQFEEEVWWKEIPPLRLPDRIMQQSSRGMSLIDLVRPETGQYITAGLIGWEDSHNKSLLSLGDGYWRWNFLRQGLSGQRELYSRHLFRVIRWLSAVQEQQPLKLQTDRYLYSSGEEVILDAQTFTADGRPITSAIIEVQVNGPSDTTKLLIEPDATGKYGSSFLPNSAGKYTYSGIAKLQDQVFAADSGEFSVEAYNIEKETLTQNYQLLQTLAERTGGRYFSSDNIADLTEIIDATPRRVKIGWSRRMFLGWDFWFLPILLLSLEWIIRKRKGML
ncbi:hypothetical protein KJ564_15315 [bacterium]|nr:hypothetical protein [bacterium]MBU1882116.1 hypothetical protein [bacterium]